MLENISSWIKQIILVVMFTMFVDFLLPENNFRKYAKVLLGFVVMIAILNPILTLLHEENYFSNYQWQFNEGLIEQAEIERRAKAFNEKNNDLIIKQYKENIGDLMKEQIEETSIFKVRNIDVDLVENNQSNDFGKIEKVSIVLVPKAQSDEKINKIEKVSVKINDTEKKDHKSNISSNYQHEMWDIHENLKKQFNIHDDNIHLSLEGE